MESSRDQSSYYLLCWLICGVAALFYLYEYLLRVVPSVMSYQLISTFHLTTAGYGSLTASYYYVYIPLQIIVGLFMDRFGPRKLLTIALISCCIGSYLFASSCYFWMANLGRLLVGFGSAFAFVGVLKLVSMWLPVKRFAVMSGVVTGIGMLGGLLGDLILSALVHSEGWRLTSYIVAAVGAILALIIFLLLGKVQRRLNHHARTTVKLLPSMRFGYIGLIRLVNNKQVWVNCFIGCLLFLPISGFAESWGIRYLVQVERLSRADAAVSIAALFLGFGIGAPIMGWLSEAIRQRRLILTFGATSSCILLSVVLYVPNLSPLVRISSLFFTGFCCSSQVLVFTISRDLAGAKFAATAVALTNMITMLAGISVWLIGFVISLFGFFPLEGFQVAMLILPAGLIGCVFLTFYLNETYSYELIERSVDQVGEIIRAQ